MSFDDFWAVYPRRIAKLTARKAWDKALKHSPEQEILDGARRYAVERRDEDRQFTKHPATWLNGGCWMDEPGSNRTERVNLQDLADELRASNDRQHRASAPDFFTDAGPQPRGARPH